MRRPFRLSLGLGILTVALASQVQALPSKPELISPPSNSSVIKPQAKTAAAPSPVVTVQTKTPVTSKPVMIQPASKPVVSPSQASASSSKVSTPKVSTPLVAKPVSNVVKPAAVTSQPVKAPTVAKTPIIQSPVKPLASQSKGVSAKPSVVAQPLAKPVTQPTKVTSQPKVTPLKSQVVQSQLLVQSIPLEIKGYAEAKTLPAQLTSSQDVLKVLDASSHLLVHMEVLRRGYLQLSADEAEKLVAAVNTRYQATPNDTTKFFDQGYTQMVYKQNKTGLFFLRKANDKIANQFTSLAYAMGQADVDLNEEKASPKEMTFRKLDVIHKLEDAVSFDVKAHQPGFWPSFIKVVQKLTPLDAYAGFSSTDFSLAYVPYPEHAATTVAPPIVGAASDVPVTTPEKSCAVNPVSLSSADNLDWAKKFQTKVMDVKSDTQKVMVNFFTTDKPGQYKVVAVNGNNQILSNFMSPVAPYILEDLDQDGIPELVIRQYKYDPAMPVLVYRYDHCGFKQDKTIQDYFQ